jgi:predicted metalloprotease with PDZ domain
MNFVPRAAALSILLASTAIAQSVKDVITLSVDAREAPRRLFHSTVTIPAKPGPLTLIYPKWIPGEHGPTGPIPDLAGFSISAAGKPIPWRRDLEEMWAIHCDVPQGAASVEVKLDYLSPTTTDGFTDGPSSTSQLAFIDWHLMLVYPKDVPPASQSWQASLTVPAGWQIGTALDTAGADKGSTTQFVPVPLTQLIDTPVAAGAHYRRIELTPALSPPHVMDLLADSDAALAMTDETIGHYKNLVAEAAALYGARHYTRYHFLCTLSDRMSHFGLEHHQCSDDRMAEKAYTDEDEQRNNGSLLSHEYTHSWNGKHRRPADLATPDYLQPMRTDLLWVYEGLTEYLGDILAARSGSWSPDDYREYIASTTAKLDHTSGRRWRPLQDTADASPFLYESNGSWENWRRSTDFYDEGELIWLEVDTVIREKTSGAKSLDDFCKAFLGPGPQDATLSGEAPTVSPYTFEDVCATLNQIAPGDWHAFFRSRLDAVTKEAPKGGLAAAGWKLVYNDKPNPFIKGDGLDLTFSIGARLSPDGAPSNIERGAPADKAGLAPAMKIVAVNSRRYSPDVMKAALKAAHEHPAQIELLVQNDDYFTTLTLDYSGGELYPHLARDESAPDRLSDIIKPHAAPAKDMQP